MILESGAKAKTVKKYLGKDWIVQACGGHVEDLPSKGSKDSSKSMWESTVDELPDPPWGWTTGAKKKITEMIKKAKLSNVEEIFIATDPDREGEFIAWRLSEIFSKRGFKNQQRVTFNEITENSVIKSLSEARKIDYALVDSAKVRRFMDRLVGFECSRFSRSWQLASMGRVQTPTLGFIVEREIERDNHVPISYHSVNLDSGDINFKVRFHDKEEDGAWVDEKGKHYPDRTYDLELADRSVENLVKNNNIEIQSIKNGKNARKPKPPFTTDTLLQTASSTRGWSVSRTSNVAGALYNSGHVTYIRTDSTRTNQEARDTAKKYIKNQFGDEYLGVGALGADAKKGSKNVQDAHEAIRPTRPEIKELLDEKEEANTLYRLIWSRFTASQMSDSIRETRSIMAKTNNFEKSITGMASWRIHPGWEIVYSEYQSNIKTKPPEYPLLEGSIWELDIKKDNPDLVSDQTKPPRRFSESSIVQQMKKAGIGRPSTYVSTIQTLNKRKYVENISGSLKPTEAGTIMWSEVVPFYNEQEDKKGLFDTKFTAKMEMDLDGIENSSKSAPEVWHQFVKNFKELNESAKTNKRSIPSKKQIQLLNDLITNMNELERNDALKGKVISELTGEEMRNTLDELIEKGGTFPPSDKQIGLIIKLTDKLNLQLEKVLKDGGAKDLESLTGGREGTASTIIGKLIGMDGESPATEPQVKAINTMSERLGIKIEDAMSIVKATTIDEINKKDASDLIGKMKKMKKR
jgi:DNA topoisomerase-1